MLYFAQTLLEKYIRYLTVQAGKKNDSIFIDLQMMFSAHEIKMHAHLIIFGKSRNYSER